MAQGPRHSFNKISNADMLGLELFTYVQKQDAQGYLARKLIRAGANLTTRDTGGNTLVMRALMAGNADIVASLILRGADFTTPNKNGMTPAMTAVYLGFEKSAKVLARAGATVTQAQAHRVLEQSAKDDARLSRTRPKHGDDCLVRSLSILQIIPVVRNNNNRPGSPRP